MRRAGALQPLVESRVRRDQRLLERRDRRGDLVDVDGPRPERALELVTVAGDRAQHLDREFVGERHLARVGDGTAGLLFERGGPAIPELRHVHAGVQHRRRVDGSLLPVVADGRLEVVRSAHAQVVTRVAADEPRFREPRVEVELLTQLNERRVRDLGRRNRLNGFRPLGQEHGAAEDQHERQGGKELRIHDTPSPCDWVHDMCRRVIVVRKPHSSTLVRPARSSSHAESRIPPGRYGIGRARRIEAC